MRQVGPGPYPAEEEDFPSFSEGLSLRLGDAVEELARLVLFPFLFGGAFIEAAPHRCGAFFLCTFPFLFGGAFIEAKHTTRAAAGWMHFPSFSEGLSLRRPP